MTELRDCLYSSAKSILHNTGNYKCIVGAYEIKELLDDTGLDNNGNNQTSLNAFKTALVSQHTAY